MGQIIERNVETIQLTWMCSCGGQLKYLPNLFKTAVSSLSNKGYQNVIYPHQCDKCYSVMDNKHRYPRLVAKGDPTDL